MEVVNNKTGLPLEHYRNLFRNADPNELSRQSGVEYSGETFTLGLLNRTVSVSWPDAVITLDDGMKPGDYTEILALRRILDGRRSAFGGRMLAYSEMPWGPVYETQFRGRCISRMAGTYGHNISGFADACMALGGIPVENGDVSFDISFMEGFTVRLIMWEGDDEFPASAQILFSDNFPSAFTAEDMAVVGDVLLNAMRGRW